MTCEFCGLPAMYACGYHGDHRFICSHRCQKTGRVLVYCNGCGARAWGDDLDAAVAALGGSFDSAGQVW